MRSSVLEDSANTVLDLQCLPVYALLEKNYFETVPLVALRSLPVLSCVDEEDLYTSFEEAISGRARTISRQLDRLSPVGVSRHTDALATSSLCSWASRLWRSRRHTIMLACLGLSLLLLGFDLMGLLVLSR